MSLHPLWAAVAGRLRPAGFLVYRFPTRHLLPTLFETGRSVTTHKEAIMATSKKAAKKNYSHYLRQRNKTFASSDAAAHVLHQ
jgi:hypothetical protein